MPLEGFSLGDDDIAGVIAFGVTDAGDITAGTWLKVTVEHGVVRNIESLEGNPPERLPTFEALGEIANPTPETVLFVAAARLVTWRGIAVDGAVEAIERGTVAIDGDEGIFIRFMDRLLALMQIAAMEQSSLGA